MQSSAGPWRPVSTCPVAEADRAARMASTPPIGSPRRSEIEKGRTVNDADRPANGSPPPRPVRFRRVEPVRTGTVCSSSGLSMTRFISVAIAPTSWASSINVDPRRPSMKDRGSRSGGPPGRFVAEVDRLRESSIVRNRLAHGGLSYSSGPLDDHHRRLVQSGFDVNCDSTLVHASTLLASADLCA